MLPTSSSAKHKALPPGVFSFNDLDEADDDDEEEKEL